MTDFTLSPHEKAQPLWVRLRAYLDDRLVKARKRNDNPASETDTATLRGEIKTLKHLLALGDDQRENPGPADDQPPG